MAGSGNSEAMVRARPGGRKSAAAFRTISEVAGDLDVAQHVLRFWESKFPQVRPLKRGGGRRYYRPEDVDLLRQIRSLLYDEGYTIKGAQKLLKSQRRPIAGEGEPDDDEPVSMDAMAADTADPGETGEGRQGDMRRRLARLRNELVALRNTLREALN
jgi:DNA-binding transcriptional MerR regulator